MSDPWSTRPPGPPSGPPPSGPPPSGPPPSGPPPSGPPPSGPPPSGPPPEMLGPGWGSPVPPRPTGRSGRRTGLLVGGGVVALAAIGTGAVFGYQAFFATGSQPAEALPDSTIAYLGVDLDPSGSQKLEALQTLQKFPALRDELDLDTDDDLRERALGLAQDFGACTDVDFEDDVEPWLGNRIGVAAVDLGEQAPTPVAVVEVTDADAADDGLEQLRECGTDGVLGDLGGDSDVIGWSIEGDWAVLARTDALAQEVTDAAQDAPLSDDDTYQRWTDAAGDPGIASAYLAPGLGRAALDGFGGLAETDEAAEGFLRDFEGAALTLRFADEGLELEAATGSGGLPEELRTTSTGPDLVEGLPDGTAVAAGIGLDAGWAQALLDYLEPVVGTDELEAFLDEARDEAGLDLPADAETLVGDGVVLAVDGDADPDDLAAGGAGVGVVTQGDPDAVEEVLDRFRSALDERGETTTPVETDVDGDRTAIGPDADWRRALLDGGDLGGTEAYRDVTRGAGDTASLLFVDFDAAWLLSLAGEDDEEVRANLEPLRALGFSAWTEDEESHTLLRVTTD